MRKIKTNFGTLYVEFFNNREEEDRIKVFDSDKRYLDYFCIEYLEEHAKMNNCTKSQQLNKYLNGLKQCSGIKNMLNYLGINYLKISHYWYVIANILEEITGYSYPSEE